MYHYVLSKILKILDAYDADEKDKKKCELTLLWIKV